MATKANRYFVFRDGTILDLDSVVLVTAPDPKLWCIYLSTIPNPLSFIHEEGNPQRNTFLNALKAYGGLYQ